ncbi:MAG: S1 family peptidase [Xanthobacteraceae bacterium]|nr:S1 family peptidase [Xanthobacteraceae bacterium]
MPRFSTRACLIIFAAASISSSGIAHATSVAISRMGEGVVCNGWAVDPDIVATAAHCIMQPGHYSISTGNKVYQAFRSWIHPEYSTELFFHSSLGKHELNPDLALLRILQKDFAAGDEKIDRSNGRGLASGSILYAVRPTMPHQADSGRRKIEEITYDSIQHRDHGILISNAGKPYQICPGDSGTPLYARVGNERTVVGVIVGNGTQYKIRSETFCGSELHVITASVILKFVDFTRAHREGDRPWMPR